MAVITSNDEPNYNFTTGGGYTREGKWTNNTHLKSYKHIANSLAAQIRKSNDIKLRELWYCTEVWSGPCVIVEIRYGKIIRDLDLELAEGKYIAIALINALAERMKTFHKKHGDVSPIDI